MRTYPNQRNSRERIKYLSISHTDRRQSTHSNNQTNSWNRKNNRKCAIVLVRRAIFSVCFAFHSISCFLISRPSHDGCQRCQFLRSQTHLIIQVYGHIDRNASVFRIHSIQNQNLEHQFKFNTLIYQLNFFHHFYMLHFCIRQSTNGNQQQNTNSTYMS